MAKKTETVVVDAEENGMVPAGLNDMQRAMVSATDIVEKVDRSWLDGVQLERLLTLADGQGIRGLFLGAGPLVEMTDPATGEVRPVGTWRFEVRPGIIVRLLGGARLDAEFKSMEAGKVRVRVARIGQVSTRRGRRVTDYLIAKEIDIASID
jgi:hypothetical protein